MHGTFPSNVEWGTVSAAPFDARIRRYGGSRSRYAALVAGCCFAAVLNVSRAEGPAARPAPARHGAEIRQRAVRPAALKSEVAQDRHAPATAVVHPEDGAIIRIVLPEAAPLQPGAELHPSKTELAVAGAPPASVARRPIAAPVAKTAPSPQVAAVDVQPTASTLPATPPAAVLRPVDIAQVSDGDARSVDVAELHEPGLVVGGDPTLTAQIAAMQVTPLPPVHLRDADRAALLAEAPTQMTVRLGRTALGKVDFRMSDARTIDVKIGDLLDLLAAHYDAGEFARLRESSAADAYVGFDQLRALGLKVRYDPAYDEVRING